MTGRVRLSLLPPLLRLLLLAPGLVPPHHPVQGLGHHHDQREQEAGRAPLDQSARESRKKTRAAQQRGSGGRIQRWRGKGPREQGRGRTAFLSRHTSQEKRGRTKSGSRSVAASQRILRTRGSN